VRIFKTPHSPMDGDWGSERTNNHRVSQKQNSALKPLLLTTPPTQSMAPQKQPAGTNHLHQGFGLKRRKQRWVKGSVKVCLGNRTVAVPHHVLSAWRPP
jgi:hypothetical protein